MGKPSSKPGANADPGWSAGLQLLQVVKRELGRVGLGSIPMGRAGSFRKGPARLSGSRFSGKGQGRNKVFNTVEPALPTET
eukprot:6848497-Karenia_brevis.AAC.1